MNARAILLAAAVVSSTSGKIVKSSPKTGRLTIVDAAGHEEEFAVDARTRTTCDGKKATFAKAAAPGACETVTKLTYDPSTKRVAVLTLATPKKDADDAKPGRANASGEVATTDVLAGKIFVRMGGGATLEFKVVEATKILVEKDGAAPAAIPFEAVKVGDRVEVLSKDWKTADELHLHPAAR